MATTSNLGEPDMALISELLEEISRHPPAIQAQKLLVEHYISVGWLDAARDNCKELQSNAPGDEDVKGFIAILGKKPEPPMEPVLAVPAVPAPDTATFGSTSAIKRNPASVPVQLPADVTVAKEELSSGYKNLQHKARSLLTDLLRLQSLQRKNGLPPTKNLSKIQTIAQGENANSAARSHAPGSTRSVARSIQANPDKALNVALEDLQNSTQWIRAPYGNPSGLDNDAVRDTLFKRAKQMESALPMDLKAYPEIALMHIQHELLGKTYVNDETMLGDPVTEISRENFWVTEDNYAWDMEELAQAITANGGIMRNPLSRDMFTPKDIRGIVAHPHGKQLAALQLAQHEMSKGVRDDTVMHLEKLGKVLLDDQSADQIPSRHAIDEFMAYCATLPEAEQKALNGLKCPAKDSHTGQAYDFTIGEAVRDAKGNRVCFHKTGDFIKQAAAHLRQNKGAPPDHDDGKCVAM